MLLNFIDLFAGAGGLSEGFIRAGYMPLAHIEMNNYACDTLKTRAAFHYLKSNNQLQKYKKYLYEKQEKEDGSKLWEQVPQEVIDTVIQSEIGKKTIENIFAKVDKLKGNKQIDVIVGGPPCQAYSVAGRARMGKAVEDDREIYKMAIDMWVKEGKRIDYSKIPTRLQHHKNKETFLNRFQVVDPYGCSHTVVAHIAMDGHYYIYPTLNPTIENVRSITIREAARLQSFPNDYYLSRSAAFTKLKLAA
ncbi:MAG: DNA cytosine methyltransferase [Dysgonamonadaceae bacterium]|jgi:site-specific DNA-cytosine methylase|nr:DNA cytosine methyltransferase [Dysgonamonadaceae bacterium]